MARSRANAELFVSQPPEIFTQEDEKGVLFIERASSREEATGNGLLPVSESQ